MKRLALILILVAFFAHDVFAQARNPFSVGISEGGGSASGITGWILAQQQSFDLLMREAVRAIRADASAFWSLVGLAFAYGVFHAAGPGHGKAVLAAYLIANERALKRGLIMAALAALLQAFVAIALVLGLTLLLGLTSRHLRDAAHSSGAKEKPSSLNGARRRQSRRVSSAMRAMIPLTCMGLIAGMCICLIPQHWVAPRLIGAMRQEQ